MLTGIQYLRFIAALAVFLYHLRPFFAQTAFAPLAPLFQAVGFAGVDVFFVISGFIMWHTTIDKPRDPPHARNFLIKRYLRIYSGYWPYLLLAFLLLLSHSPQQALEKDILGSTLLYPISIKEAILPVSWTLGYELYFYTIFFLLLFLPIRGAKQILLVWGCLLATANIIGILYWDFYSKSFFLESPRLFRFVVSPYALEFIGGVLIRIAMERYDWRPWLFILLPLSVTAFFLGGLINWHYYANNISSGYHQPYRVAIFGTAALLLVAAVAHINCPTNSLRERIGLFLGGSSYSLYLAHTILLLALAEYGLLERPGEQEVIILLVFGGILLYSMLHYILVEKPLYGLSRERIMAHFGLITGIQPRKD